MLAGLVWDPSKVMFSIGSTVTWLGFIQSYFGGLAEIEGHSAILYYLLGVPLTLGFVYLTYNILVENLSTLPKIGLVVILCLAIQAAISWLASRRWKHRNRIHPKLPVV